MLNKFRIKKRLTVAFIIAICITALGTVLGGTAMLVTDARYSRALTNYGFSQGDIGKTLIGLSNVRATTRAVISYTDQEVINQALTEHDEMKTATQEYFVKMQDTLTTDDEYQMYEEMQSKLENYWVKDAEILELGNTLDADKSAEAQTRAHTELDPLYTEVYDSIMDLLDVNINQGDSLSANLTLMSRIFLIIMIIILIVSVVVSMKLGESVAEGIAIPLGNLSERLRTFAEGNLEDPFPETTAQDEVTDMSNEAKEMAEKLCLIIQDAGDLMGKMASGDYAIKTSIPEEYTGDFIKLREAMALMRDKMNQALRSVEDASGQVSAGSTNLAEASQSLAEGATEQAGAIEELQATIADLTVNIQKTAEHAEQSYVQADKYANEAEVGRKEMQDMVLAMERINETSKQIENIISDIEDIASQTNLLSLNASIEAARAGEAGRGFAVVADQIRQLAEQSTQSAVDTRTLIEGSLQEIVEGNKAAERAAGSIETVVDGVKHIADASKEMSVLSRGQAEAMKQAEVGLAQISEVVQSNSATAEESSATSEELSAQAVTLDELIGQFTLS